MQPYRDANRAEGASEASGNTKDAVIPASKAGSSAVGVPLKLVVDGSSVQIERHRVRQGDSSIEAKARQYQYLATRQSTLIQLTAQFLDQPSLQPGLISLCEALHQRFNCERVVIGLANEGVVKVHSISQQSSFDPRSGEVRLLNDALQEACDQDEVIHFVIGAESDSKTLTIVESHRAVLSGIRSGQICTLPLCCKGDLIGALLFESHSDDPWSGLTIEFQKQISKMIASLIAIRQAAELSPLDNAKQACTKAMSGWIAPRRMMPKLCAAAITLAVLVAYFIPVAHRLNANAELVSTERRLITSPLLGYLDSVHVEVGDTVEIGQTLLSLDVKDYEIDARQLESKIQTAESEYRSAMASYDRKAMAVAQAQLQQVRSELDMVKGQIDRAEIVAPAAGMVVSGELTQKLGAPVDRGETLLEIAPATNYQIQLMLNEADVGYIQAGQLGNLTLKSSPFDEIGFKVVEIHPIAVVGDGATRFRVDAIPTEVVQGLRPGQTGIAKIDAGDARLLWVWTHRFTAWGKLKLWRWFG